MLHRALALVVCACVPFLGACSRDCPEEETAASLAGLENNCPELLQVGRQDDGGAGVDAGAAHLADCPAGDTLLRVCAKLRNELDSVELVRSGQTADGRVICTYRVRSKPGYCATGSFW